MHHSLSVVRQTSRCIFRKQREIGNFHSFLRYGLTNNFRIHSADFFTKPYFNFSRIAIFVPGRYIILQGSFPFQRKFSLVKKYDAKKCLYFAFDRFLSRYVWREPTIVDHRNDEKEKQKEPSHGQFVLLIIHTYIYFYPLLPFV